MNDGVPVIRQENPRGQQKTVFHSHAGERTRQARKIPLIQSGPPPQQVHSHKDESVIEKGSAQTRHGHNLRALLNGCKAQEPRNHKSRPDALRTLLSLYYAILSRRGGALSAGVVTGAAGWLSAAKSFSAARPVFAVQSEYGSATLDRAPLTEHVGLRHAPRFSQPLVMITISAAIRFHSGKVVPSPRWASKAGLEWLWCLLHEATHRLAPSPGLRPHFMVFSPLDLLRHKRKPAD